MQRQVSKTTSAMIDTKKSHAAALEKVKSVRKKHQKNRREQAAISKTVSKEV